MPTTRNTTSHVRQQTMLLVVLTLCLMGFHTPSAGADSTRELQWYLEAMRTSEMWQVSEGAGVTVAVIDSGVDSTLPELRGQVLEGADFTEEPQGAHTDIPGHGTSMAALIAGTGESGGIQGLAPKAKILPVRNMELRSGFGPWNSLAEGIEYSVEHGAKIINISQATVVPDDITPEVQEAVDEANRAGALIFASSGNEGDNGNNRAFPAGLPGVVAVGATGEDGKVTDFSSYGPHLSLTAPGSDMAIRCDRNTTTCESRGGTSGASALASASAALIWSAHPDWTANQVLRVLIETTSRSEANPGDPPSKYIGYGAVRPRAVLVDGKGDPGDPDTSPLFSKYYAHKDGTAQESGALETGRDDEDGSRDQQGDDGRPAAEPDRAAEEPDAGHVPLLAGAGAALLLLLGAGGYALHRRRQAPRG